MIKIFFSSFLIVSIVLIGLDATCAPESTATTTTPTTTTPTTTTTETTTRALSFIEKLFIEPISQSTVNGGFSNVIGIAVTNDYIFLSENSNNKIYKYDLSNNLQSSVSSTSPYGLSNYLGDKVLVVVNYNQIQTVDNSLSTTTVLSGFNRVYGIYYDAATEKIYVPDHGQKMIYIYNKTFNLIDSFSVTFPTGTTRLYNAAEYNGVFYASYDNSKVQVIQNSIVKNTYQVCTATNGAVRNMYVDRIGENLVLQCNTNDKIVIFKINGITLTKTTDITVTATRPRYFTFDKNNILLIAYAPGYGIVKLA